MSKIIDGRLVASKLKEDLSYQLSKLGYQPTLAVILVGDDPASKIYVQAKTKECKEIGILAKDYFLPSYIQESELISLIENLNNDESIDAILVQLPLPKHLNTGRVISSISPFKDVDGFHPVNIGKLAIGEPFVEPCTPKGVIYMLDFYGISIEGKNSVVLGRSNIVGKPLSMMLLSRNSTVTICHSKTNDLVGISGRADMLFVAIGKPLFVKENMVKADSVVIDIGINRIELDGKLKVVGDVDFDSVKNKVSYITPVPGGVGLMTRAMLLYNTYLLAKYRLSCKVKS